MNEENSNKKNNESTVVVDGIEVKTRKQKIVGLNIITVEAGTTGYCGGDSGHGGRTVLRIKDESSTDMRCRLRDSGKEYEYDYLNQIDLILGGDSEMETLIEALEFAVDTLKKQIDGKYNMTNKERRQEMFRLYLSELVSLYRRSGKLSGMSSLQKKYRVSAITQAQFFECGLNEAAKDITGLGLDKDFANKVYDYILDKTKANPAPKYKSIE